MHFPPEELETTRLLLRRPTIEDAEAAFESYASDPKISRFITWSAHRVEVGFALGSRFWGQGYMPEALEKVCEAAFEDERIARVQALCDEENLQSSRVMEKVGMRYEGRLRQYGLHPNRSEQPRDCLMYSLVRGD